MWYEAAVKLGDVEQEKVRRKVQCDMSMGKLLLLFHEDLPVGLKEVQTYQV